jgi:hypothetical protein
MNEDIETVTVDWSEINREDEADGRLTLEVRRDDGVTITNPVNRWCSTMLEPKQTRSRLSTLPGSSGGNGAASGAQYAGSRHSGTCWRTPASSTCTASDGSAATSSGSAAKARPTNQPDNPKLDDPKRSDGRRDKIDAKGQVTP